ncbi:MAG: SemiSWEET transporter [Cyanobacteriota bacterium]|nr:SemiSWEET transporter [Cyanobacteriota bacterium]
MDLVLPLLGYTAAVLTTVSFYPQAIKTLRTNDTRGLSLRMYLLFTVGVVGWGVYGLLRRDWPVFVANLATLPATLAILERKIRGGGHPRGSGVRETQKQGEEG